MAGELNGIAVTVALNGTDIAFGDVSVARNGSLIPITNRSHGGKITYLNNAVSGLGYVLTGTLNFMTTQEYEDLDAARDSGAQQSITVTYAATGKVLTGTWGVSGFDETAPLEGAAVSASVTLESSGDVTRTPITIA